MNTNNTNHQNNTLNASGTNGSSILNGNDTSSSGSTSNQTKMQTQLLECLEKLDLILANQIRLEQLFASQGILAASQVVQSQASINA